MQYISKSLNDTKEFAQIFSKKLKKGNIVTLEGDLGAGKTTFVKFLCESLGVNDNVSSPTFAIVNEYDGKFKIYHADLYRLESLDEVENTGFLEILKNLDGVCFIEWPQIIEDYLPKNVIRMVIKNTQAGKEFLVEGL